ncbi:MULTISPECIES: helix-turn-helix domain-containing protein [Lactococcus]|uniref:helix-turn-helix domain-containing protein n=1 Tax=Lactococcus TaxID=1357 RepID=UPI0002D4BB6D|nr:MULTISPECIES: helix-turn-helix transcriptional regulator [Lactococcus]MCO7128561.1 helix-turn-helix domain-containing protein [Lactococcus garvieae]
MTINLSRIKAERIANDLTQEDVAKKMGWKTRTPYAKRENGLVAIGADELIKLASIFGYSKDDLGIFFKSNVPEKEQKAC